MPLSPMWIGNSPAPWAASTQRATSYWWHSAAMRSTGTRMPNTLEAMVHTASLVLGPMAWRKALTVASLSPGDTLATV